MHSEVGSLSQIAYFLDLTDRGDIIDTRNGKAQGGIRVMDIWLLVMSTHELEGVNSTSRQHTYIRIDQATMLKVEV